MVKFWKKKEPPKPEPPKIRVRVGLTDRFAVYSIGAGWEIGQTMMGQKLIAIKDIDFELDSRTML